MLRFCRARGHCLHTPQRGWRYVLCSRCLINHSNGTQCQIPDLRSFYGNQRMQKWPKMVYLLPIVSFGCNPTEAFKSHPENWEAYFIKWTTSVEPTVGSKSPQDSKWGHSWAIDYFILLSWPCTLSCLRWNKPFFWDFRQFNSKCLHHCWCSNLN